MTGPALVTGGSGFVGGALLERLIGDGREVRALTRSEEAAAAVSARGATPVSGDVLDLEGLADAMHGCEIVFHAAGVNAMCLSDPRPMVRANVEGSGNVIVAARRAGVRRVVYTSSASAIGEPRGTVGREDSPHRGSFLSSYERSKYLAERRVLAWSEGLGVDVVCVNPSSVQGPGRTGGSARLLLDLANGRLPALVNATISIVDVADCTQAHVRAEERGARGERYVVSGATLTMRQAVDLLRTIAGVPKRARFVPPWVARAGGSALEAVARLAKRDPPVCREAVRTLLHGHRYDGSRAERELGLHYTPLEETMVRTLSWYAERGLAPPPRGRGSRPTEEAP